jgi:hypothetical protein
MIKTPDYIKRYNSAKARFLHGILDNFFKSEFPKLIGPILREKLVDELENILEKNLQPIDYLKPGQMLWNAVDIRTRADSKNPKFVPVVLTLINQKDIDKLTKGTSMSEIMKGAIARIQKEAYAQGGLLSMRDISFFSWRRGGDISRCRLKYEKEHDTTLPNTGSLQDMGSCISHKKMIIKKIIIDKKDTLTVAKETNHSIYAVERYLKDFYRVQYCYDDGKNIEFASIATGLNKFVVKQYFEILDELQKIKN